MNKKEIYLRWAVSLCLLACVVVYQMTRSTANEPSASVLLPAASSEAAASPEPAASSETASPAPASPESSEPAGSEAAAESEAASAEAASPEPAAAASETPAPASSKAESAAPTATPTPAPTATPEPTPEPAVQRGPYNDGVYTGSGKGFGGKIIVSVTIQNGYIAAIDVTSAEGEDKPYLRDALQVINKVIAAQSTQQDAISGATSTTWGILDAIDDALKGA